MRCQRRAVAALLGTLLLYPSALAAQSCGSLGQHTAEVWDAYLEGAREVGCLAPLPSKAKTLACAVNLPVMALHMVDHMVGWWNAAARGGWATFGPRRLSPTWQTGTLWGTSGRSFLGTAPVYSTTTVSFEKLDGRAPAELVICATGEDGETRRLAHHRFDRGKDDLDEGPKLFVFPDLESELISVKIDAKDAIPTNRFRYRVKLVADPVEFDRGPVRGFADLHLHQAAELGFGGNQLYGSHTGPQSEALSGDGHAIEAQEALLAGPVEWVLGLHSLPGFAIGEGDSRHGHGHPSFDRWPHYDDVTHQQAHEDWLRQAHDGGLNLVVVSAVNFEPWCRLLKVLYPRPGDRMGCRDMENVRRQLEAFIAMDERHDWYEIAVHPWHARKIIHEGKLAVVLSMEVSRLFPTDEGDFVTQLDRLWGMGLRTLQIAHETDSRFAGAAPHRNIFEVTQAISWPFRAGEGHARAMARGDIEGAHRGFLYDEDGKNAVGLHPRRGVELVEAMIDRRMLIDVAHLSERSVQDLHQLVSTRHSYYPLYDSHTRFEAILTHGDREIQQEFLTTDEKIRYLRETGGIVGLRTGQNAILTVDFPGERGVPNDCDGSSKSFAQLVHYGKRAGIPMALGSDFNGFINQLGPRYGGENGAEHCPAAGSRPEGKRFNQADAPRARCELPPDAAVGPGPTGRDFDTEGLRHVGYLPDLVADLEALETPGVEILKSSAEAFLRMWERAYDPDRSQVGDDVDLGGAIAETVPDWTPCDLYRESLGILLNLSGDWVRTGGNNPRYDGMRLQVKGDEGTLTRVPSTGPTSFSPGQVLWQGMAGDGTLEVRGSDGDYYEAEIVMEGADRLHVDIDHNGRGNDQTWERAGPTIDGEWELVAAAGGENVGIRVRVEGDRAVLGYVPPAASRALRTGDVMWRGIGRGDGGEVGYVEVLSADRSYESAEFTLQGEDRLRLVVGADGADQRWARPGVAAEAGAAEASADPLARLRPVDFGPGLRAELAAPAGALPTLDALALTVSERLPAVVAGRVFHDLDADGAYGGDEPGLPGVSVRVMHGAGFTSTVRTDAEGVYRFESGTGGTLRVSVDASTLPIDGTPTTHPAEHEIEVDRGFLVPGLNFGIGGGTGPRDGADAEPGDGADPDPGSGVERLQPVETGVTGFVGVVPDEARTSDGSPPADPGRPVRITRWEEFTARLADPGEPLPGVGGSEAAAFRALQLAVRGFFANGGRTAWVVRVPDPDDLDDLRDELDLLAEVDVDLVSVPGATRRGQHDAILDHVAAGGDRVALLDGRSDSDGSDPAVVRASPRNSDRATVLFPWLLVLDPVSDQLVPQPPSGHVAGILARGDREEGVHGVPAGRVVSGAIRPAVVLSEARIAALNQEGVMVLREEPAGVVTWGARTISGETDGEFRYLPVRRTVDRVVETIVGNLGSESCEQALGPVDEFLDELWREGALQGATSSEAYFVRCRTGSDDLLAGLAVAGPGQFLLVDLPLGR